MFNKARIFCAVAILATAAAVSGIAGAVVAIPRSSPSPITVGVICTCSGPFGAAIDVDVDAYKAWVDTANSSGGVDGHHIKLITYNTTITPGKASSEIKKLIAAHVDALLNFSLTAPTWAKTIQAAGIPVVGGDPAATTYYQYKDFYPAGQTQNSSIYSVVVTAKKAGVKNLAYFYCTDSSICTHIVPIIKSTGAKQGLPVVYEVAVSASSPNYDAQCVAAEQDHVQGLYIGDSGEVISNIAKSCNQEGFHPIYVTEGGGFSLSELPVPGLKTNSWDEFTNIPYFDNIPEVKIMNAAMTKYFPGVRAEKTSWPGYSTGLWASGILLATALNHGGLTSSTNASPKMIIKGLDSLKNDTLDGMSPPITFSASQKTHSVDCWFIGRLVHGKQSVAQNGKPYCETGGV